MAMRGKCESNGLLVGKKNVLFLKKDSQAKHYEIFYSDFFSAFHVG